MEVLTPHAQAAIRRNKDAAKAIDPQIARRHDAANKERVDALAGTRRFTLYVMHAIEVTQGIRELPLHCIAGEPFVMSIREGVIELQHEQWSLQGEGATLLEAEQDLLRFATAIAPAYVHHPSHKLTERAQALKDFLLRVI